MSWQQFANIWEHYGPGAAVVAFLVLALLLLIWGIRTLVKWWPVITQFITTINIVAKLPERLDKIDADNLSLNDKFDKQKKQLDDHLTEAKAGTTLLTSVDARLISVEEKAGIAADKAAVAADRADVAAEQLRRNGGSTMKDKVDVLIPNELAEIKALIKEMMKDSPPSP